MARRSLPWLVLPIFICATAAASAAVPTQFIAKMYSEALGRAPDPQGWSTAVEYFQSNGCNQQLLTQWGGNLLASAEFSSLGYDAAATALVLFRSILNREPDSATYQVQLAALQSGASLATVFGGLFSSQEFASLVPYICSGGSYSFGTLGSGPAIQIPFSQASSNANLSEAQLQALLNSSAAGDTVYLPQKSVIQITQSLTIPAGVTLATEGLPSPRQHALMARLVRAAPFASPMIQINLDGNPNPSGALRNLWVDGQRTAASAFVSGAINVEIYGGTGATVDSSFMSNSLGWSTVHSYGSLDGRPCASNTLTNNVITAYPSVHANSEWTDGLSVGCENTLVQGNQIIDPTDVGIVVFTAYPATQKTLVTGNVVVSAGNSAFGAMGFDPLQGRSPAPPDFTGSSIENNTLWSGPNSHFIIGLAVGSRPWYGSGSIGFGASATGNTTAGIQTEFGAGIVVSGMTSVTVEQNVLNAAQIPTGWTQCPTGNVLASVSAGLASGSIQTYSDVDVNGCMSDYSPVQSAPAATTSQIDDTPTSPDPTVTQMSSTSTPTVSAAAATSPSGTGSQAAAGGGGGGGLSELELMILGAFAVLRLWHTLGSRSSTPPSRIMESA
jgi:hypothetical protein